MAITLGAELAAAQTNISRKPIIELIAGAKVGDIPFDGSFLTGDALDETAPFVLLHSSGRMIVAYLYDDVSDYKIKFRVTNTERTVFEYSFNISFSVLYTITSVALAELDNGNIGVIYTRSYLTGRYLEYKVVTIAGASVSSGTIQTLTSSQFYSHVWVEKITGGFIAVYVHGQVVTLLTSGGTYTGGADAVYTVQITTAGSKTTAYFQWKKDSGAWNGPIQATGTAQALSDGVTITFNTGSYYVGQEFTFNAYIATYAAGSITINAIPALDDTVTIGSKTYTFKDELVDGGNENEVKIDYLSTEITLENLRCAVMDDTYEGTGEGVRYGNGTAANAEATAIRTDSVLDLTAITAGAAGNSITLTVTLDYFSKIAFQGGADASISAVTGGTIYTLYKRTSTNFTSWTAETEISLAGILPSLLKDDPSITLLDSGDLMLSFAYGEQTDANGNYLTNVYYATSSDSGSTWDTPTKLTQADTFAEVYDHPVMVQKTTGDLYAILTKKLNVLSMRKTAANWPDGTYDDWSYDMCFDAANRKLYVVNMYYFAGTKVVYNIVKIDVDTWTVDKYWDRTTSTPRLDATIGALPRGKSFRGGGNLIPLFDYVDTGSFWARTVNLIDGDADTIRKYHFVTDETYGYSKNVNYNEFSGLSAGSWFTNTAQVDTVNNRLYLYSSYVYGNGTNSVLWVGYFDLTQTAPPYTFVDVIRDTGNVDSYWSALTSQMLVVPESNRIFLSGSSNDYSGGLRVYDLSGNLIDDYRNSNDFQFPKWGLRDICYYGGYLFGSFYYEDLYDQDERRGLCRINLATRQCTYHRPTWDQLDDYAITSIELGAAGELIVTHYGYGVSIYNIYSDTWEFFNNATLPGIDPNGDYGFYCSAYDAALDYVIVGLASTSDTDSRGIRMFSSQGQILQSNYASGVFNDPDWTWSSIAPLVQGYGDFDAVTIFDSQDLMTTFWQSDDREWAVKWDTAIPGFDLAPFLITDDGVTISYSVDGSPATLSFNCSHGHLFDPFNSTSLYKQIFKKGKEINVRIGEDIGGTAYWQQIGKFYVQSAVTSYKRGVYSKLAVRCSDDQIHWIDKQIVVSEAYNDYPHNILSSILQTYCGIAAGDIDYPSTMSTEYLSCQFVDEDVAEVIQKICNRFGYFSFINSSGKYTARKIAEDNTTDHTYTDADQIIEFSPNNTYSNNINQITVVGQEFEFGELSTEEEPITDLSGTCGWNTGTKEHQVWYSEDHQRTVQTPRLEVITTATSIGFALSGEVSEDITYIDPDNKYCIVTVYCPDLTEELILALVALIASFFVGDIVVFGYTIRVGSYLTAFACWWALNILGATATYSYAIHGYPVGSVRRSVQATANDLEHQAEIGYIISQQIECDLCRTVAECLAVAEFELMAIRLDRKKLSVNKVAHLQDEIGDTLIFPHPYTLENMKMFVTEQEVTFRTSSRAGDEGDSGFYHKLDGWVIDI